MSYELSDEKLSDEKLSEYKTFSFVDHITARIVYNENFSALRGGSKVVEGFVERPHINISKV